MTLARTFSKIRGGPHMKVGWTSARFSTILSMPAVHRSCEADVNLDRDQGLTEDMAERQPQVLEVVGANDVQRLHGGALVGPAVLRQAYALGPPGGTGGVDQRRQVFWPDPCNDVIDRGRISVQTLAAQLLQIGPADHLWMINLAVQLHDRDQLWQLVEMIKYFAHLQIVFGEDHLGFGIGKDEADILMLC